MRHKKQKGFTLVEMLVVIVVIGILATIVLVSVSSGRKKAQATKAKTDMVEMSKAFEMAAAEGCRKISFTGGVLTCDDSSKTYITLGIAPTGIKYTITMKSSAANLSSTSNSQAGGNGAWASTISAALINNGYEFKSEGFTNGTFICSDGGSINPRSGCYCLTDGGCTDL